MARLANNPTSTKNLVRAYIIAKEVVIARGFADEIDWQEGVSLHVITERDFLRESAWVVLSSGMRASVIREKFAAIGEAFYGWKSADEIAHSSGICSENALSIFNHRPKIDAIVEIAKRIAQTGFDVFKTRIASEGVSFIQTLPFMGAATSFHLAKNVGLDVAKPDRHLLRIAASAGFGTPQAMCETISEIVGDRVSVVDLVIWRFATLHPAYDKFFAGMQNRNCKQL